VKSAVNPDHLVNAHPIQAILALPLNDDEKTKAIRLLLNTMENTDD